MGKLDSVIALFAFHFGGSLCLQGAVCVCRLHSVCRVSAWCLLCRQGICRQGIYCVGSMCHVSTW